MIPVKIRSLVHDYVTRDEEGNLADKKRALDHIELDVEEGQFIAVLGANGSGKSTLAKHINALLLPTSGQVLTCDMDTADDTYLWEIRKSAGMVFQNPTTRSLPRSWRRMWRSDRKISASRRRRSYSV